MEKLVDTRQIAEITGLSEAWFERARWMGPGHGPKFLKLGRSVRYSPTDVEEWLRQSRVETLQ